MSDHPTERIRTDDALLKRINEPMFDPSDDTKKELNVASFRKAMQAEEAAKKTKRRSTLAMAGTIVALVGGVLAILAPVSSCGRKVMIAELSDDFATKPDLEVVRIEARAANRKLDWLIIKLVPNATPPSFEERTHTTEPHQ